MQPPPLELPNERSVFSKLRIALLGFTLRTIVDVIAIPRIMWPQGNRFKMRIDNGTVPKCRVCVYTPSSNLESVKKAASAKPRGVIVHLHAGGWTIGRPEYEGPLCRYLSDSLGVVVVAPDYCKAPRYPYPHALEQIYSVLSWIASGGLTAALERRGITLEIDSSLIALSGASSGSNLAASLTLLTMTRPLPNSTRISCLGLLYPALNLAVPYVEKLSRVDPNQVLPPWMSRLFLKAYLPPPRASTDPYVSPALAPQALLASFPPTVILTAAYDYLAHEAEEFAGLLSGAGVPVTHKRFAGVGHAFDGMPARKKEQRALNDEARDEAWGMMAVVFRNALCG